MHHRSLESAIERSWVRLDADLQRCLSELSVFKGPFSLTAAKAVVSKNDRRTAIDMFRCLANKSLLQVGDARQLSVYRVVREYAAAMATAPRHAAQTRLGRHLAHLVGEGRGAADWLVPEASAAAQRVVTGASALDYADQLRVVTLAGSHLAAAGRGEELQTWCVTPLRRSTATATRTRKAV